jgi:hypothetical protein
MQKLAAHTDARNQNPSTDDLLYMLTVYVRKAEREPETADASIIHAMRVFDRIVERMA